MTGWEILGTIVFAVLFVVWQIIKTIPEDYDE